VATVGGMATSAGRHAIKTPPHHSPWSAYLDVWREADQIDVFESAWNWDHFYPLAPPYDGPNLEGWTMLAALAQATTRLRLGAMVNGMHHRHPAVTANMAATLDVISGGRFELGIGAGWYEHEWLAYGYGFPPVGERLGQLGDHLEVISRMLGPGRATFAGRYAEVDGAINEPKGVQPHMPVIVGGNGRRRTAGYAVRFADELNYVFLPPDQLRQRIAEVRARCESEGRDPATLRFSMYVRDESMRAGPARVDALGTLRETELDRIVCFPGRWDPSPDGQAAFAEDCRAAGFVLGGTTAAAR
jgi:F420-dependent oxidoreductase-like protein